jgi:hypothetical protein
LGTEGPVFVIGNDLVASLQKETLSYLPQDFWKLLSNEITTVKINRPAGGFSLERGEAAWKISAPFTATPFAEKMEELAKEFVSPKADSFVALDSKEDAKFGFDKPFLQLTVTDKDKKEKTLLLGKIVSEEAGTRYARLKDKAPIAIVNSAFVKAVDVDALDLLDPMVMKQDPSKIKSFKMKYYH